jgi:hypothetical protein
MSALFTRRRVETVAGREVQHEKFKDIIFVWFEVKI